MAEALIAAAELSRPGAAAAGAMEVRRAFSRVYQLHWPRSQRFTPAGALSQLGRRDMTRTCWVSVWNITGIIIIAVKAVYWSPLILSVQLVISVSILRYHIIGCHISKITWQFSDVSLTHARARARTITSSKIRRQHWDDMAHNNRVKWDILQCTARLFSFFPCCFLSQTCGICVSCKYD